MQTKVIFAIALLLVTLAEAAAAPLVIAHRGASAYLPEHTLAAKVMAFEMGADYIEQDIVLTRDGVPIVFHDLYLDAMTDVAEVFKGRARADGKHYVIDFDYAEIQKLTVNERIDLGTSRQLFGERFPAGHNLFRIHTLDEELELLRGLEHSTGREVGIYVELKNPRWHAKHDHDIALRVLPILHDFGYRDARDRAYLQSFDAAELRRIKAQNMTELPLIQLIGENRWWSDSGTDYDHLKTPAGLAEIKTYAAGIGPWYRQILLDEGPTFSSLVADARKLGLKVHPYTLRADALPKFVDDFDQLLAYLFRRQRVDGVFTDHPDKVLEFLGR